MRSLGRLLDPVLGERKGRRDRKVDALGQDHDHLAKRQDDERGRVVEHARQVCGRDKGRKAGSDQRDKGEDGEGQEGLALFQQTHGQIPVAKLGQEAVS